MKKIASMILAAAMMFSVSTTAFAHSEIHMIEHTEREYLISKEILPNGVSSKTTAQNHSDGSVTYTYYENGRTIRKYTVVPGSGKYMVEDYTNTETHGISRQSPEKKMVYVKNAARSIQPQKVAAGYNFWGTANYYNSQTKETYTVYCTIKEDVNELGSFSPVGYYLDQASFIVSVIAVIVVPIQSKLEAAAAKVFNVAKAKGFLKKVVLPSKVIQYVVEKTFTLNAEYTQYHIHGVGLGGNPKGEFHSDSGYKASIYADQGLFSKQTYSEIWTRDDWKNPTLGRLLFWHVYEFEYTPTSWNR